MTGRLAGDDDAQRAGTLVHSLMLLSGRNLDSFAFLKNEDVIFDLHSQFAVENIEELARSDVGVADLAGPGWHEFFDNAKARSFDQMPAIAVGTPFIMFGRFDADYLCRHV